MDQTKKVQNQLKQYEEPKLVEWGTITKLTQGGLNGLEEALSGTQPAFGPPGSGASK